MIRFNLTFNFIGELLYEIFFLGGGVFGDPAGRGDGAVPRWAMASI